MSALCVSEDVQKVTRVLNATSAKKDDGQASKDKPATRRSGKYENKMEDERERNVISRLMDLPLTNMTTYFS